MFRIFRIESQLSAKFKHRSEIFILVPNKQNVPYSVNRGLSDTASSSYKPLYQIIAESRPTAFAKDCLLSFHDFTGLPWWGSIILSTIALRCIFTFPLAIYQAQVVSKIENISMLEMPEASKKVKRNVEELARKNNWSEKEIRLNYRRAVKKEWDSRIVRDNCHPFKGTITMWVQIPTWIWISSALRNMTQMLPPNDPLAQKIYIDLSFGGFLWIPNLTQPDGLLILPLLLGASNLLIIEIQAMMRLREPTKLQRYITKFFRIFSILLIPISAFIPSGLSLYWTASSLAGLSHNLILLSPKFRSLCRIPDTPTTLDHPYTYLVSEIKHRAKSRFQKS